MYNKISLVMSNILRELCNKYSKDDLKECLNDFKEVEFKSSK